VSGRPWLAAYAAATALSFPHVIGSRVLDLGLAASWLGPACLVLGLRGLAPGAAARAGFAAGLAAHALVFHWIYVVTVDYGHAPPPVGVLAPVALALYPAAFTAAFAAGAAQLARGDPGGLPSPWTAAAWWAALDHGRTFALTGFPWALLGYAQHENAPLLALAPYTGVFGLSFATALGGIALAALPWAGGRARRRALLALATVALLHGLGALDLARDPGGKGGSLVRVGVLQGNVDQGVKWSPAWAERTLELYEELTRQAAAEGAALVLWPETAVPGSPDASPELAARLGELARETRAALVVGAVGLSGDGGRIRYYDSAFLFDPEGRPLGRYDKAHLVPFGEYVPLRALLGHFVEAVARGAADTDVSAGEGPRAPPIPIRVAGGGADRVVTAGVPICYELLFPDLVRRFVEDGAQALLAITNDAWYGRTGAPYQFLAITALRSAENRVWTARAANTGVSAFIDDRGRVRAQTPIFERRHLVADIVLADTDLADTKSGLPPKGGSFYARRGDWFAAACWATAALALARAGRRGRSERR
jgi:apolipoprotein N-acyltransferase